LLTVSARYTDGILITHSFVRKIFSAVFEAVPIPITQRQLSQKTEEMGARLCEPSSLTVLTRITGVPKYKIAGSIVRCIIHFLLYSKIVAYRGLRKPVSCDVLEIGRSDIEYKI